MKDKLGKLCIVLGIVLVLAAVMLLAWNIYEAKQAERAAQDVLTELMEQIDQVSGTPDFYRSEMKKVKVDGYEYIGYLSIPAVGIELPVMAQWDYGRLKLAPCRYSGSVNTGDLVIAAHNYSTHFRALWHIPIGETVYFTDMEGICSTYEVEDVETLSPTSVKDMTDGEYPLTLFTCNYGGSARVTVRCSRSDPYE